MGTGCRSKKYRYRIQSHTGWKEVVQDKENIPLFLQFRQLAQNLFNLGLLRFHFFA